MNNLIKQEKYLPVKLSDLVKFILVGREKLVSVRAQMRAIDKLDLAAGVREQKKEEATILAGALLDAEARIGELIKNIPNKKATAGEGRCSLPKGITHKQSSQFQTMSDHPEVIEQVKAEAVENDDLPTRTEVLRKIKENEKIKRINEEKNNRIKKVSDIEIRKGDFKIVLDDITNIDAIITDPPYPHEFINCFSELSLFAKGHLKKGGFIAVYSGQFHLPEVIKRLSEHLTYVWTFCLYHSGKKQLVNNVNIMCGWKPVLIFSNGNKKMRFSAYDVLISEQREKSSHKWQQNKNAVKSLIGIFSKPGELIVDPFCGSGTFGLAANELGRKFIGAEIL